LIAIASKELVQADAIATITTKPLLKNSLIPFPQLMFNRLPKILSSKGSFMDSAFDSFIHLSSVTAESTRLVTKLKNQKQKLATPVSAF
jgi:hypothetical protein